MLVLTRKLNESVMIGDDVEVRVLSVSRDKIRLGISAPKDVPVFRTEVYVSLKDAGTQVGTARQHVNKALGELAGGEE